jgi:hypothetical protein
MKRGRRAGKERESGFALLLVFAMAAIVCVMLYVELPRVAFEAQRTREETLIDRGEQYTRAIRLYMRKFPGKYPASIDQLESTNNMRFLRRRYKDPMTGSDEWRIIHAGPGGVLTDSLIQKPPEVKKDNQFGTSIGKDIGTPIGSSGETGSDASNVPSMVPRTRPSEAGGGQITMPGFGDQGQQEQPIAQDPGAVQPGQPVQFQPGQPGQPSPGAQVGTQPGFLPPIPGLPAGTGSIPSPPVPPSGIAPPAPAQSGQQAGTGTSASPGAGMIDRMLRQPAPQSAFGFSGQTIGAGIAGVASKFEARGIKVYNDRTKYNEWEFVYDPRKDMANPMGPQPGLQPQPQTGSPSSPSNPSNTGPK